MWQAEGQWQTPAGSIDREQSKVLLLVHADTAVARQAVQEVIQAYRKSFEQESVLCESSRVCVASQKGSHDLNLLSADIQSI